jgi:transposase
MWIIGVDLHKKVAELVALDVKTGELRELGQCGPKAGAVLERLEDLDLVGGVIIEAVNGSVKLYHDLTKRGCAVKLVPSVVVDQMRIGQRAKTDRSDAQLLASYGAQLHLGLSAEQIWAPEEEIVSLRQLTRTRNKLVSQRTAIINVLHGLLQAWGIVICLTSAPFGHGGTVG